MFDRLQHKWKVSGPRLALILVTFAVGGSLTGYAGRRLMNFLPIEQNGWWVLVYIILVTLIWPFAVLFVSIPFGQFRFFTAYLKKMGTRMGMVRKTGNTVPIIIKTENQTSGTVGTGGLVENSGSITHLAIFASGTGSNAQKIIDHFRYSKQIKVALVVSNKEGAGVVGIAQKEHIPVILLDKEKFFRGNAYVDELKAKNIDMVVLAGFLWKVPTLLIRAYHNRIINIHPALLPKYGGKGMYGQFVHETVLANKEKESGISIHFVDDHYDHGQVIFQATCPVLESDTPESLAQRIHKLEHEYYPKVIEQVIKGKKGN